MADLQRRRQLLDTEIAQETERLLAEQRAVLTAELKESRTQLHLVNEVIKTAESDRNSLLDTVQVISKQRNMLEESRNSLQREVDILIIDRDNYLDRLRIGKNDVYAQNGKITSLNEEVDGLDTTRVTLEADIGRLTATTTTLAQNIAESEAKYADLQAKNETIEAEIDGKIRLKQAQLDEFMHYESLTRQELTDRQLAIDERETVVTVRERKVDMAEQVIQQNAGLLEL